MHLNQIFLLDCLLFNLSCRLVIYFLLTLRSRSVGMYRLNVELGTLTSRVFVRNPFVM